MNRFLKFILGLLAFGLAVFFLYATFGVHLIEHSNCAANEGHCHIGAWAWGVPVLAVALLAVAVALVWSATKPDLRMTA